MEQLTVPLEPEKLVEIFKDKDKEYEILVEDSVAKSKMEYKQILMYLSNLKIKGYLNQLSADFLKCLLEEKFLIESKNTSKVLANIYLYHKFERICYQESLQDFSVENIEKFVKTNSEVLDKHRKVFESIPAMLLLNSNFTTEEEIECIKDKLDKDDSDVGSNVCSVLELEDFLMLYITSEDLGKMLTKKWYPKLFDDYHFNGKKLIQYVEKTEFALNLLALMKYGGEYSEYSNVEA